MNFIQELFRRDSYRRLIILICVGVFLYIMRSMLNLFLLTFIFTYLMYSIQNFLSTRLKNILHGQQRTMVISLYLLLTCGIAFALYKFIPILVAQSSDVINQAIEFYNNPHKGPMQQYIVSFAKGIDLEALAHQGAGQAIKYATDISHLGFSLFIAIILSLFFLLEKNRIVRFTSKFKNSKLSPVYNEIAYFGKKFLNSFGKVIEAQVMIAFINSILSVIALAILGFPQLFSLGITIFLLGLIPVAGVFISLIPLSLIAFKIGGVIKVVYVLIMVAVLHALEAYLLNPKLMSSKTELPVFYTFIVLLVSEHFLGVWGLIIGIPIFMFLLDLLDINSSDTAGSEE